MTAGAPGGESLGLRQPPGPRVCLRVAVLLPPRCILPPPASGPPTAPRVAIRMRALYRPRLADPQSQKSLSQPHA